VRPREAPEERTVVSREPGGRRQRGAVSIDQRLGHRRGGLEREAREEVAKPLGRADLAVIDGTLALGLVPAGE